jgi:phosphoglucosamine mutase
VERLFGTDGVRGRANEYPITPELVLRLGKAIGVYLSRHFPQPRVLIGKDTRRSCYMLEQALGAGICSVGADAYFLGPIPTPGIAYLTRGLRACAGIVISASHNPYDDNGIKIFSANGYKLPDSVEDELEEILRSTELDDFSVKGAKIGRARRIDDAIGQYAVFLKEQFPKHLTLEGLRIIIDCANGAGYRVAPKVFEELGAEVVLLGVSPNGVNINDGCGALHPESMVDAVLKYRADFGLALDGDADRLVVVDDHGSLMDGDEILAICGLALNEKGALRNRAVVSTVMSNGGLQVAFERAGIELVRAKVGDRYVVEEMLKRDLVLGGEASGHLIFRNSSTTGDGILAALHLIEVMIGSEKPLSELRKCMEHFPQVLKSIPVGSRVPLDQLPKTSSLIRRVEEKLGAGGRVLFRYSGTEKKARVMVEGPDYDQIKQMADEIGNLLVGEIASIEGAIDD